MSRMVDVTTVLHPGAFLFVRVEAEGIRLEECHPPEVDEEAVTRRMKEHVLLRTLARKVLSGAGGGTKGCN